MVIFNPLKEQEIGQIVELEIVKIVERIEELGYKLKILKSAKKFLCETGYDEEYGARPLNRAIQKYVEDPISEEILKDNIKEGQTISISYSKVKEKIEVKVI